MAISSLRGTSLTTPSNSVKSALYSNNKIHEANNAGLSDQKQSLVSLCAQNTINVPTKLSGTLLLDGTQNLELQLKQFIELKEKGIHMVILIFNQHFHTHTLTLTLTGVPKHDLGSV